LLVDAARGEASELHIKQRMPIKMQGKFFLFGEFLREPFFKANVEHRKSTAPVISILLQFSFGADAFLRSSGRRRRQDVLGAL
jgi:hypothetical protein